MDGAGADIKLYDAAGGQSVDGNESAAIEVSNDGGVTWFPVGTVGPGAGYELDLAGTGIAAFNRIKIIATDWAGQTTLAGFDLDAVKALHSLDSTDIVKALTGNTKVEVGAADPQSFSFKITITNNTGDDGGLAGLEFRDTIPAEFNLDPDKDLDAIDIDNDDCTCEISQPKGADRGQQPKLEPEFLTIDASGLADEEEDEFSLYEPTSFEEDCELVLNEGVKVYDEEGNFLFQDDDSLTLYQIDCPFDLGSILLK